MPTLRHFTVVPCRCPPTLGEVFGPSRTTQVVVVVGRSDGKSCSFASIRILGKRCTETPSPSFWRGSIRRGRTSSRATTLSREPPRRRLGRPSSSTWRRQAKALACQVLSGVRPPRASAHFSDGIRNPRVPADSLGRSLGVLAGDHLKTASDLGMPLVGVGLWIAPKGTLRQALTNTDGCAGRGARYN